MWKFGRLEVLKCCTLTLSNKTKTGENALLMQAGNHRNTSANIEMDGGADFFKGDG